MTGAYASITEAVTSLQKISKLGLSKGIKPAKFSKEKEVSKVSLRDQFMKLSGPDLVGFLAKNRSALNQELLNNKTN